MIGDEAIDEGAIPHHIPCLDIISRIGYTVDLYIQQFTIMIYFHSSSNFYGDI